MKNLYILNQAMKSYYYQPQIKFQIIKYTQGRDFAFLTPTWIRDLNIMGVSEVRNRNFNVPNVQGFDYIMNRCVFHSDNPCIIQIYYSAAKYNPMPKFSGNMFSDERKNQVDDFKENHWKSMVAFDLLIDIDARPSINSYYAWYDARKIRRIFDRLLIPYSLRFSGSGFHLVIPGEAQPLLSFNPKDESNIYRFDYDLINLMHDKLSGLIDVTTWDSRQLIKIPFSLAFLENEIMVTREFDSAKEFGKFKIDDYTYKNYKFKISEPFIFNRVNLNNKGILIKLKKYLEAKK